MTPIVGLPNGALARQYRKSSTSAADLRESWYDVPPTQPLSLYVADATTVMSGMHKGGDAGANDVLSISPPDLQMVQLREDVEVARSEGADQVALDNALAWSSRVAHTIPRTHRDSLCLFVDADDNEISVVVDRFSSSKRLRVQFADELIEVVQVGSAVARVKLPFDQLLIRQQEFLAWFAEPD